MKKNNKTKGLISNKGLDIEEKVKYLEEILLREKIRLCSLMVVYKPSCGCEVEQFVLLDRYPMSDKIWVECPVCKNFCLTVISDPLVFHLPLIKEDFTLEDLKNMVITESSQKPFIEAYVNSI